MAPITTVALSLALSLTAAGLEAVTENKSCAKRPQHFMSVPDCCDIPPFNYGTFKERCQTATPLMPYLAKVCFFQCLFNATGALSGYELNLPQVHDMLTIIFPEHDDFASAFYKSFSDCAPLIKSKVDELMASAQGRAELQLAFNSWRNCLPFAYVYASCAHIKMLQYCPAYAWHSTDKCEKSRAYIENCAQQLVDDTSGKWRSKKNKRKRNKTKN